MEMFVPFKIAKKLKEKGFTLPILEIYGKFDSDGLFHSQLLCNYCEIMDSKEIIAPTISQVLKWLREQKKINIEIFLYNGTYSYYVKSVTQIYEDLSHQCLNDDTTEEEYDSYEEAAIAGIEYCLDNLI